MKNSPANAETIIKICRLYESMPVDKQNQIIGLISFIIDALPDPSLKSWLAQWRAFLESMRKKHDLDLPAPVKNYPGKSRSR